MRPIFIVLCFNAATVAEPPVPKFEPQTLDDKIQIGYGVATGEVDGDGHVDVLLADAKQIVWYRNPGEAGKPWAKHVIAENLTPRDNVCLAARDIDGDGKVELAVGAQWNPGETTNTETSGAIFYLIRPADPTQKWEPVQIKPHEPTVHRMHWVRVGKMKYQLAVLPLHGVGNKNGEGATVNLLIYDVPDDPKGEWKLTRVDTKLHATHNFDVRDDAGVERFVVGGTEGVRSGSLLGDVIAMDEGELIRTAGLAQPVGELRFGSLQGLQQTVATIEPMHGNRVVCYLPADRHRRSLDDTLREGHAIASADLLHIGRDQILAGWRMPNAEKKVGIKMYVPLDDKGEKWAIHVIDDNKMSCEDLKVADLNGDGRLDIVASGRLTKNVIVYWNRTEMVKNDDAKQ